MLACPSIGLLALLIAVTFAVNAGANHSVSNLLSVGVTGGNGALDSNVDGFSDDGTRVFFNTSESLIAADTDTSADVYERSNGNTTLVSTGATGGNGAFDAQYMDSSKDGVHVFFETDESMVSGDTDAKRDVYERSGATTSLVSTGPNGGNGALDSFFAGISQDGLHVFFHSYEPLVVADNDSGRKDVYDRYNGTTTLVSTGQINGNGLLEANYDGVTPDGSIVWFHTMEALASNDTDAQRDVYQRSGGTTTLVSIGPDGGNGAKPAFYAGSSINGARVFIETSDSLVSADTDAYRDVYERSGGTTTYISTGPNGGNGAYDVSYSGASLDGSRVFFITRESMVATDSDSACPDASDPPQNILQCYDVYERVGGTTLHISTGPANPNSSADAAFSAVSQEGNRVFFETSEVLAANDVDGNGIDVYERSSGSTTTLTSIGTVSQPAPYSADLLGISSDGTRVFFGTYENITPNDTDGNWLDIYERFNSTTTLISTGPTATNSAALAYWRGSSFDGTRVFFQTDEALVAGDTDVNQDAYSREAPIAGYPRPKGANPFRVSLVPAFAACAAANKTHAPPLAFGSCSPVTQESPFLTVGSPDANSAAAASVSSVKYQVVPGDLQVSVVVNDVKCRVVNAACPGAALSDFTGRLLVRSSIRLTDKSNGNPATESATTQDFDFDVPVQCAATTGPEGGSCVIATSANSLLPGAVVDAKRAIWQAGQVEVRDPGPNGTGFDSGCPATCGDGDESAFMRQGIFAP